MLKKPAVALFAAILVVSAACGSSATPVPTAPPAVSMAPTAPTAASMAPTTPPAASGSANCTVGVSWNNFQQPRWAAHDKPNIQQTVEAGGGKYIDADANLSNEQQLTDVDTLISKGANVLILLAQDQNAILPAVAKAKAAGIPIIAYDRLIEDPSILYITFDNVGVGKAQAAAVLAKVPTGNYVIIKGDPGDPNAATFLPEGYKEAGLMDKVTSGAITILNATGTNFPADYGTFTDAWKTETAQANMETIIDKATSDGKPINAILAENDSTALGVVAAETAKNMTFVPLSGQDGDTANLNNVALGKQYVDVWKNANELGKAAGAAALALCKGTPMASLALPSGLLNPDVTPTAGLTVADFTTPGKNTVKSFILQPQPLTADKLQQPIDAGYISKADLCKGVDTTAATAPAACK
jgi:D-xylose transport system substrate-binding protein